MSVTISVITVTRNKVRTVEETIASVQLQTYPHIEHVIQDCASTDGTRDVIEQMLRPGTSLESAPAKGFFEALNRGIERSSGEVVGLMHADDLFAHEDVLSNVAARFAHGADGVYGDYECVAAKDPSRVVRHWTSGHYRRAKLSRGWVPPHPTLYLRREVYETFGGFDTDFRVAADYEAMMRFLTRGELALHYLPQVLVRKRVGGANRTSLGTMLVRGQEELRAMRRHHIGGVGTLAMKNARQVGQLFGSRRTG